MHQAIVLGGGRSRRMGRDKMAVIVDGRSLLRRTVDAALGWADRVVVVAPEPPGWQSDPRVSFLLEDPPFGGPVAGIAAGLAALDPTGETLLLAGDLAAPEAVVARLAAAEPGSDGVVLCDEDGWAQYLAGRYRTDSLARAVVALGGVRDVSVRRLARPLDLAHVDAPVAITRDLDTPEDLANLRLS